MSELTKERIEALRQAVSEYGSLAASPSIALCDSHERLRARIASLELTQATDREVIAALELSQKNLAEIARGGDKLLPVAGNCIVARDRITELEAETKRARDYSIHMDGLLRAEEARVAELERERDEARFGHYDAGAANEAITLLLSRGRGGPEWEAARTVQKAVAALSSQLAAAREALQWARRYATGFDHARGCGKRTSIGHDRYECTCGYDDFKGSLGAALDGLGDAGREP
jgi:hypothetical protein